MSLIKSVKMENFRGYADRNNEVEFRPGINLILGDNATGKSTIVVLILFNLLHKKIDVTKFEDYRTLEPQDLGGYRARLSIVGTDGKEYAIEKILQGKSVKIRVESEGKELKKFGELELTHYKEAQQFILERLGATEEIIENILVQVQDPVKLLWPVGDAKEVGDRLSKLLRFEPLKNVYVNAHSAGRMLADKAEGWEREVREIKRQIEALGLKPPEDYEKEKKELEDQRQAWEEKAKEIRSKIEEIKGEKEKIDETIGDLQEKAGELRRLTNQKITLEKEIKGQKKPEKTSKQLQAEREKLKNTLRELQREITAVEADVKTLRDRAAEGEEERDDLQLQIKRHQEEYEDLLKDLRTLKIEVEIKNAEEAEKLRESKRSEYKQLGELIGGLKEQVKIESQYIDILSKAEAACPVCDSSLTDEKRREIIAKRARQIEGLKDQIKQAKKKYEGSEKAIELLEKISSKLKKLADLEESLSKEKKKIDEAKNKLPQALERQKALGERQTELEAEIERTEKQIELSKKFERIEELEADIGKLQKELLDLPLLRNRAKDLQRKIDRLAGEFNDAYGKSKELGPKIESAEQNLKNSKAWYGKLAEANKRAEITRALEEEVKLASEAAKVTLHELLTEYRDMINYNLAWIWPIFYPRPDLKEVQLDVKIEEVEENGEKTLVTEIQMVRIGTAGEKIPLNTISSHGQRVLVSIAFRIAFLNLLSGTSIPRVLVLDEPTIWIDNKNRERLGQLLANLVKEIREGGIRIDQAIVVSHDPAFLNAIDPEGAKYVCVKNSEGFCEISREEI